MKTLCLKALVGTRLTKRQNEMKKHEGILPSKETEKFESEKIPRSKERKRDGGQTDTERRIQRQRHRELDTQRPKHGDREREREVH